jgi:transcriptional regulator with XRE-family HTH domain
MPPTTAPPDTAHELRRIRQHLGLSQARMAQRLGVTRVTLARWETTTPAPLTALYLARFLAEVAPLAPPRFQRPGEGDTGLFLAPGSRCLWQASDPTGCAGPWYSLQAPVYGARYLYTEACEAHILKAYEGVITQIRHAEEARQARAARTAKRHATHAATR